MADEEEPQEVKPVILENQYRIFANNLNCQFGYILTELLYNDNDEQDKKHIIYGTLTKNSAIERPKNVEAIIEVDSSNNVTRLLILWIQDGKTEDLVYSWLHSDVIIYDLNSAALDEVEYSLKSNFFIFQKIQLSRYWIE